MIYKNLKKKLTLSEAEILINTDFWCFGNSVLTNNKTQSNKSIFINKYFINYSKFFGLYFKNKIKFPLRGFYFNSLIDLDSKNLQDVIFYYKKIFLYFISCNLLNKFDQIYFSLVIFFSNVITFFSIHNEIKH
jgi:hypothetical protein